MRIFNDITTPYKFDKKPDVAYPTMDGEDVVCSNCGYILGWGNSEDDPVCPSCGCKLDWSGCEC